MELKRVRFFGDWDKNSVEMGLQLKAMCSLWWSSRSPHEELIPNWMGLEFVPEDEPYDYAVVFNFPKEPIECPEENRIGLLLEPPEILEHMYQDWVGRAEVPGVPRYWAFCSGTPFPEALGLGFSTVAADAQMKTPLETERKGFCMIASNKTFTPYHHQRRRILEALLESNLPIDFYGRGLEPGDDPRIKGEIPPGGKGEVLSQYDACIDFENSPHDVITDKFFDPVFCGTVPITNARVLRDLLPGNESYALVGFDAHPAQVVEEISWLIRDLNRRDYLPELRETHMAISGGKLSLLGWIRDRLSECES